MGVEPFLIASTVRVVIAQRLVRRLCVDCREKVTPDDAFIKEIFKAFQIEENGGMKRIRQLEEAALNDGIGKGTEAKTDATYEMSSSATSITRLYKAHEEGCDSCNGSGYKGRLGIYEVLANTNEIQKLIVNNSTSEIIEDTAIKEGMITMQLDGLIKALRGQTTIEEVLRVTSQE